jgi:predicted ATPase
LGAGLTEMQSLVRDAFRRVRRLKDAQAERLRRKLLLTGFKYEEVAHVGIGNTTHGTPSLSKGELVQQRHELIAALNAVGIDEAEARREIDPFFDRVIKLADRVRWSSGNFDMRDSQAMLEALLNQASLRRLRELVETVREFNSKSEQLLNRFQSFVECINRFFADSHKKIDIDPVGAIRVHRPDGTEVPLEALSSGERQLLVMFGHVFFSSFGNRSNAFVIDEPELSLHLRWQEILLQEMMDSSSRAQLIIATHSPEIVGDLTANCVGV